MAARRLKDQRQLSESWTDSWWVKLGSKIMIGMAIVAVFLTLVQCTVKKPESPSWTTQLTIPLINRTYQMPEIVDKMDQEGVGFDADSNIIYSFSQDIDTFRIDQSEMDIAGAAIVVNEKLGPIQIDPPVIASVTVPVSNIGPLGTFIPGTVPAASFNLVNSIPQITTYTSVSIHTGRAAVIVTNLLGVDLSVVTIELWDAGNGRSLGTQAFQGGIADSVTDTVYFLLDGVTLSNTLETRVSASTPGGPVASALGKRITTDVNIETGMTVISALTQVPSMTRTYNQSIDLSGTDPIYDATFYSGTIAINIGNLTTLAALVTISFPDIYLGGVPLSVQKYVSASGNDGISIDLTGYDLKPADSTVPQGLTIDMEIATVGTAPNQVLVDSSDGISVTANLFGLGFSEITGPFSAVTSIIPVSQQTIDVPKGLDSLELSSAVLTLEIINGFNLPGTLDLTLVGNNGKTFNLVGNIAAGQLALAVTSTIVDNTVASFLSPMPSTIDISGTGSFGDGVTVGTITPNDFVVGRMTIVAPLEMIINQTTIETDIESTEIDTEDIDIITEHLVEARLLYNIANRLPLGFTMRMYLGGDSATLFSNPELLLDDIIIPAAPTVGGIANDTSSTGYLAIILDNDDIQVLENDTLFIGTELVIHGSGGLPVKLVASDFLTITSRIEIEYLFDGNF